jgi:hypothetical protein
MIAVTDDAGARFQFGRLDSLHGSPLAGRDIDALNASH